MQDFIVIGAGHNGLICAIYLAKAGFKVTCLGGACVTEELWPGFKVSRGSYVCGLFRPRVINDLGLKLPLIPRKPSSFTPDPLETKDGGLLLGLNKNHDFQQIAKYSLSDAKNYLEFERVVYRLAQIVDPIFDIDAGDLSSLENLWTVSKALTGFVTSGRDALAMTSLIVGSASNQLSSWFESEPLRSTLATDALIGTFAGPSTPGTGFVMIHHMMGGGSWSYVRGGMGTITQHLRALAEKHGVKIMTKACVSDINLDSHPNREGGSIILKDGRVFNFRRAAISNLNPKTTLSLVRTNTQNGEMNNERQYRAEVDRIDFKSPVMKINLALDSLPVFPHGDNNQSAKHSGTIHLGANSLDELDASFSAAQRGEFPVRPMIEMTIPSALDDSLAPRGKHVCSLFVQHVPAEMSEDFWQQNREKFADRCIKVIDELSPGFSTRILHRDILSPLDLQNVFGLEGGNIFHGSMTLDRLLHGRPVNSYFNKLGSSYATPYKNLFLCSAGTHPGGGVMGACGRNAALAILRRLVK